MKIEVTITETEIRNTLNSMYADPCGYINCAGIDCDNCPLQATAEEYRIAKEKFINILKSFSVEK